MELVVGGKGKVIANNIEKHDICAGRGHKKAY
jgi:hypothetical protein